MFRSAVFYCSVLVLLFNGCGGPGSDGNDGASNPSTPTNPTNPTVRQTAYEPEENLSRDDVYQNGRVVHVRTSDELSSAIEHAEPYTTILMAPGRYEEVYATFPEGIHHITLKGEGDQTVIVPKSYKQQSAFVLYNALSKETQTHDINFVDFSVEGDLQDAKEFLYVDGGRYVENEEEGPQGQGRPYGPYNIYIAHISFKNLFMGLYSHLYAHDWTVDSCNVKHSTHSHFWYMMGWHLAMINSTIEDPTHTGLSIRGYYPEGEVHTYIDESVDHDKCYGNKYVLDRGSRTPENGFLASDDWTHLIENNRFKGSSDDSGEHSLAFVGIGYGIYDDDHPCDAERTYLPPQNIRIVNNQFDTHGGDGLIVYSILIDAWQGLNNDSLASINGLTITGNKLIRKDDAEKFIEMGDTGNTATDEELNRSEIHDNKITTK